MIGYSSLRPHDLNREKLCVASRRRHSPPPPPSVTPTPLKARSILPFLTPPTLIESCYCFCLQHPAVQGLWRRAPLSAPTSIQGRPVRGTRRGAALSLRTCHGQNLKKKCCTDLGAHYRQQKSGQEREREHQNVHIDKRTRNLLARKHQHHEAPNLSCR